MGYRVLLQLGIFLLPFIAFGLYRLAIVDAEAHGKKAWPISALFLTGMGLTLALWLFFIFSEDRTRNKCIEAARFENGVLIEGGTFECEKDIKGIGAPLSDDPGAAPQTGNDALGGTG